MSYRDDLADGGPGMAAMTTAQAAAYLTALSVADRPDPLDTADARTSASARVRPAERRVAFRPDTP